MKKFLRYTLSLVFLILCNYTFAQNIIVTENQKPGTTEWILTKVHADTSRLLKPYKADLFCRQQDIEGFVSKRLQSHGHLVDFSKYDIRVQKMTKNLFNKVIGK